MTEADPPNRVYFPELDGLRFVAIALVYVFHQGVPQFAPALDRVGTAIGWHAAAGKTGLAPGLGRTIVGNGWIGVQLFFLLSGFLITTLLLREESRYGRIDLRAFWMRRILRIWPLYYLVVLLTFFVLPFCDGALGRADIRLLWSRHLVPFLLFAGNWSMGLLGPVPYDAVSVLWSVCVEEQFYLLCPLLIAGVRPSRRIPIVLSLMICAIVGRFLSGIAMDRAAVTPVFFQYSTITQLDTLLSGVLLALLTDGRRLEIVGAQGILIRLATAVAAIAVLCHPNLAHGTLFERTAGFAAVWMVGMGVVAIAQTGRGVLASTLRYESLVWLGRISYGLYMFHEIAFWAQRHLFDLIGWFPNQEALAPFASAALTIGLAATSYYGYERRFLRLKGRWSRVPSRPV